MTGKLQASLMAFATKRLSDIVKMLESVLPNDADVSKLEAQTKSNPAFSASIAVRPLCAPIPSTFPLLCSDALTDFMLFFDFVNDLENFFVARQTLYYSLSSGRHVLRWFIQDLAYVLVAQVFDDNHFSDSILVAVNIEF